MSFSAIIGQDKPIALLRSYIQEGCLEGGYLFCGPQGVGKKMAAKELAKALNCDDAATDGCGACASCAKIDKGWHPDVHLFEFGSDEIKIEYVRQLQKELSLRPYEGRKKVCIIDNAHNLTADAANALLKVLEEPPKASLIILVSDKPALLFKTILSRCKAVKFSPLSRDELKEFLVKQWGLDHNRAHFLAYFSEGRLGRALSLKDTDIINHKNRLIDKIALAPTGRPDGLDLQERGQLSDCLNILAAWFRDVYWSKAGQSVQGLINFDRRAELPKCARQYSFADLERIMRAVSDSALYLERNLNTKLLLHNLKAELWKE